MAGCSPRHPTATADSCLLITLLWLAHRRQLRNPPVRDISCLSCTSATATCIRTAIDCSDTCTSPCSSCASPCDGCAAHGRHVPSRAASSSRPGRKQQHSAHPLGTARRLSASRPPCGGVCAGEQWGGRCGGQCQQVPVLPVPVGSGWEGWVPCECWSDNFCRRRPHSRTEPPRCAVQVFASHEEWFKQASAKRQEVYRVLQARRDDGGGGWTGMLQAGGVPRAPGEDGRRGRLAGLGTPCFLHAVGRDVDATAPSDSSPAPPSSPAPSDSSPAPPSSPACPCLQSEAMDILRAMAEAESRSNRCAAGRRHQRMGGKAGWAPTGVLSQQRMGGEGRRAPLSAGADSGRGPHTAWGLLLSSPGSPSPLLPPLLLSPPITTAPSSPPPIAACWAACLSWRHSSQRSAPSGRWAAQR